MQNNEILTIKHILREHIKISISSYLLSLKINTIFIDVIPLNRIEDQTGLLYVSAIALKIATFSQQPKDYIAQILQSYLIQNCPLQINEIRINPQGWIYFYLNTQVMVNWLEQWVKFYKTTDIYSDIITDKEEKQSPNYNKIDEDYIWKMQYIYARCCSLLRLAHTQGLISKDFLLDQIDWLLLVHPAEKSLFAQLSAMVDSYPNILKSQWGQLDLAFANFYSQCGIFGEVIYNPELAQSRLGLLVATLSILKFLLQNLQISLYSSI